MKRSISIFAASLLLVGCLTAVPAFAATTIDYSFIEDNSDTYFLDVQDDYAFVDVNTDAPAFIHLYSPDGYNSLIYSDIIILDYGKSSAEPIWRIWIDYCATQSLSISSVSIDWNDMEYTFDVVSDNMISETDAYVLEEIPIFLGAENVDFWTAFLDEVNNGDISTAQMTAVFHGEAEDVTVDLPMDFVYDLGLMGLAMYNMVGTDAIMQTTGATPVTTVDLSADGSAAEEDDAVADAAKGLNISIGK